MSDFDFDEATITGLVVAAIVAALVVALVATALAALTPAACRESITADYGRCDIGATVSLEMGDRVVCRCPSPGGTVTIAAPRHGGTP